MHIVFVGSWGTTTKRKLENNCQNLDVKIVSLSVISVCNHGDANSRYPYYR